jgi:large subunit ribosomal protein L5
MSTTATVPYLKKHYLDQVVSALMQSRGLTNRHQVPKITKVVINSAFKSDADKNHIAEVQKEITAIAGQKAVLTRSRKAVSNFKLRQGQVIGSSVTLRGNSMYEFLFRLIGVALPTIRDFRGVNTRLDGAGNYNLGITDITIFPEITVEPGRKLIGCDIAIVTNAGNDDLGRELIKLMGMPFRRPETSSSAPKAEVAPAA